MGLKKEIIFSASRKDFRVDTFKSGGKGGQHQNKTDSGVRITHLPSGISAESRTSRSQRENRKLAFRKLAGILVDTLARAKKRVFDVRRLPVVRTYTEHRDLVLDHRTGKKYSYRRVLGGNLFSHVIEETAKICAMMGIPPAMIGNDDTNC